MTESARIRLRFPRSSATALALLLTALVAKSAAAGWPAGGMRLSLSDSAAYTPVLAPDGAGGVIVAWFDHRDVDIHAYATRRAPDGSVPPGWVPGGVVLAGDTGGDPAIAPDARGGAYVGWKYFGDVAIQHITTAGVVGGEWYPPNGVTLPGRTNLVFAPRPSPLRVEHLMALHLDLVVDPGVGVVGVYSNNGRFFNTGWAWKAYEPGAVVPPGNAGYGIVDHVTYDQNNLLGVDDGASGILVAYTSEPGIKLRRFAEDGSAPAGWPGDQGVLAFAGARFDNVTLGLCPDGAGGAFIAASDPAATGTGAPALLLQHVGAGGALAPGWPAAGLTVAGTAHEAGLVRGDDPWGGQRHSIAPDGAGGAIITWTDLRSDGGDIYAQRVQADGALAPGWPAGGRVVASGSGSQHLPQIAPDGEGGAYLTWVDLGTDPQGDLVATHLTASGVPAPGWPEGGRVVAGGAGGILNPRIAADGIRSAYVAWADTRDGQPQIRLARIEPNAVTGVPRDEVGRGTHLVSVRPDPWRADMAVSFTLDRAARVQLELLDVTGRRWVTDDLGVLGAGEHVSRLAPGRSMPAGVYLMRVRAGGVTRVGRAVHVH
jgi:hypothetical protein